MCNLFKLLLQEKIRGNFLMFMFNYFTWHGTIRTHTIIMSHLISEALFCGSDSFSRGAGFESQLEWKFYHEGFYHGA